MGKNIPRIWILSSRIYQLLSHPMPSISEIIFLSPIKTSSVLINPSVSPGLVYAHVPFQLNYPKVLKEQIKMINPSTPIVHEWNEIFEIKMG